MKAVRTSIFWLHLAVGCIAGLVILVMSVTGVLLAFERQINNWADAPAVLQSASGASAPMPLDALLASLSAGGQGTPSQLVLHNSVRAPVEARFGRSRTLFLNPWTGEIVGQPSTTTRAFFGSIERLHRSLGLGMRNAFGRGITGAANLGFLFMLISGAYLWLPRIFNLSSLRSRLLFRGGLTGRAREWNWHNVIGIWTLVPLFVIVLSGVIMSYPWASNLLFTLTGSKPPAFGWRGEGSPEHPSHAAPGSTLPHSLSLDALTATAKQQIPAWKSITVEVPQPDARALDLNVDTSIGGQPDKSTQLVLNRQSGQILAVKRFDGNSLGSRLRAYARFLHTGEELGITGEIIAALASLGAVFLVWTGISMALRRAFARKSGTLSAQDARSSSREQVTV